MSSVAYSTPNQHQGSSMKDATSPRATGVERKDEETWSGEDEDDGEDEGPNRKRARTTHPLTVSCELCKVRKVKCGRERPSCGWCLRNGQVCEYRERKKPGLRAGYGRELEARLDKLEDVLQSHNRVLQGLVNHLPGNQAADAQPSASSVPYHGTQAGTALFMQTPNMYAMNVAPRMEANVLQHQLDTETSLGSPNQQPDRKRRSQSGLHVSATAGNSYAPSNLPFEPSNLVITAPTAASNGPIFDTRTDVGSRDQDFPPYDLLYALTDLYFKHINTWCPILHRRTTLDVLFGSSAPEEADRIILHAIVATTLRFSTDRRLDSPVRERYHSFSKQKVLLYGLENSSVKALQALVILALDIVGNSNGPPGWNLLALMARSVIHLGLAVETTSASVAPMYPSIYTLRAMVLPEPESFVEDESRRRLFWMIYLLDRYATIATAFEFALDDKEIDRKLPCREELFARNQPVDTRWLQLSESVDWRRPDHPENLGSFSYYIEILGILSQTHRFLKKPVDIGALSDVEQWQQQYRQLDSKLNEWRHNLPGEYGNMSRVSSKTGSIKTASSIWVMMHMTFHTTVIRLHSSAAYPTTRSPIFTPSYSASQRCHTAVEDICDLCSYVKNNDMLTKLGPPFAFSLWVAARLLLVHGSTIDHHVNPAIHPLVETLREMGCYWKVAERYATLLQRVLDEYHDSERAPPGVNGIRETPSSVRILADMRRCAYDLDFLISRQPKRHMAAKSSAVTPARTPAPSELEYLDLFDFFNMPRLPFTSVADTGIVAGSNGESASEYAAVEGTTNNEFNITNFMYDANSDWFTKA